MRLIRSERRNMGRKGICAPWDVAFRYAMRTITKVMTGVADPLHRNEETYHKAYQRAYEKAHEKALHRKLPRKKIPAEREPEAHCDAHQYAHSYAYLFFNHHDTHTSVQKTNQIIIPFCGRQGKWYNVPVVQTKGDIMDYCIRGKKIEKKYKRFALDIKELNIPSGYATALIGENGAGKTTLLTSFPASGSTSREAYYFLKNIMKKTETGKTAPSVKEQAIPETVSISFRTGR